MYLMTTRADVGDGSMSVDPFDGGPGDKLFHGLGLRIMRIVANSIQLELVRGRTSPRMSPEVGGCRIWKWRPPWD
jgi:hypothetical protein